MTEFEKFVKKIMAVKVGAHIMSDQLPSNFRLAISTLQIALNRKYASRSEENGVHEVYRLK